MALLYPYPRDETWTIGQGLPLSKETADLFSLNAYYRAELYSSSGRSSQPIADAYGGLTSFINTDKFIDPHKSRRKVRISRQLFQFLCSRCIYRTVRETVRPLHRVHQLLSADFLLTQLLKPLKNTSETSRPCVKWMNPELFG